MLEKNTARDGRCQVTFTVPAKAGAQSAQLVGDFNGWSTDETPMERRDDGSFSLTLELPTGESSRFRYLLDGERWENDWAADGYVANDFGGDDSLVQVPDSIVEVTDNGATAAEDGATSKKRRRATAKSTAR